MNLINGWRKNDADRLAAEIEDHIKLETQRHIAGGVPEDEARYAAIRRFGNVSLAKEDSREVWGWLWLERVLQDVRYALRGMRKAPGFTTTILLTLALGLGLTTAMLAIVSSVLLRPLALPHAEQLMLLSVRDRQRGTIHELSYTQIETLRQSARSFSAVSAYNTMARPVGTSDGTRMAVVTTVTPQFFKMLGTPAKLGRLSFGDLKQTAAVVSAAFWRERLHGDPKAVGSTLRFSGQLHTVVGVLPGGVRFPQGTEAPVVYIPVLLNAKGEDQLLADSAMSLVRLRPGVSKEEVIKETQGILAHSAEFRRNPGTLQMRPYADYLTGNVQAPLLLLLSAAGVLLLVALANATNLQIARVTGRRPEMAARTALGASFGRLLQQLATESLAVSLLGAVVGWGLAFILIAVVRATYGAQFSRFDELAFDPIVFGASALLGLIVGLLASIAPALGVRSQAGLLQTPASRVTPRSRVPAILVALQIALTCVLLTTGVLLTRAIFALQNVNLGFDARGITTLVLMPENLHRDPEQSRQTDARLLESFEKIPGVQAATMQSSIPFSNYTESLNGATEVGGRPFQKGDAAFYSMVSSNFVRASRIKLLRGRGFVSTDDGSAAMVALVNQAFVQKYLPHSEPIGASIKFHRNPGETDADLPFTKPLTIVGVIENELQGGNLGAPYEPMVYIDFLQLPKQSLLMEVLNIGSQFAVRSTLPQATIERELRAAVKRNAPEMVEMHLQSMEQGISQSLGERRLALRIVSGFAASALILSAIGIYGVLAYSVVLRRKEIGIRLALGSSRRGVVRLITRQAGIMLMCGLIFGALGAWAAGIAVKSFLFGITTIDMWTFCTVTGLLLIVGAIAASVPALQAAQVDPLIALRAE